MSLAIILMMSTLSACDKTPSEHLQSLTKDNYPVANMPDEPLETPLEINIEPKRLAMTSSWSAGVKDDGTLWTWGTDGLLRDTKTGQDPTPRQVEGVNDAVAVSGAGHMLLLRKDGTVWGWGSNSHGEIDPSDGDIFIEELRQIKGIENVVDIAAGEMDSIFLTNNGEVYVLGSNEGGWVNEIPKQLIIPTKVPNLSDIIRIEFRNGVLLALDKKGELYSTGKSERALGRLLYQSQEPEIEYHPAAKVALPKKTIDFSVTSTSAMAVLEDGSVWNWGSNSSANLALSDSEDIKMPEKNPYLHKVVNIGIHAAVTSQGDLYTLSKYGFGKNKNSISAYTYNKPFLIMQNIDPDQIVYGYLSYAVVTNDGNVWFWNWNENGQRGTGEIVESMEKDYVLTPEKSLFTLN